jgi:hypothetical protein
MTVGPELAWARGISIGGSSLRFRQHFMLAIERLGSE